MTLESESTRAPAVVDASEQPEKRLETRSPLPHQDDWIDTQGVGNDVSLTMSANTQDEDEGINKFSGGKDRDK